MADYRLAFVENYIPITCTRVENNVGVSGLSISATVMKYSNNNYWNGSNWVASGFVLTMSGCPYIVGEYEYTGITVDAPDELLTHMYITSGLYAFDAVERIEVINMPVSLSGSIDGQTLSYVLECAMGMFNGNMLVNGNNIIVYKRDNTTPLSVMQKSDTLRTRVS